MSDAREGSSRSAAVDPVSDIGPVMTEASAVRGLLHQADDAVTRSLLEARQALDVVLGDAGPRGIERLFDGAEVHERLVEMVARTTREIVNLHAGAAPTAEQLEASMADDLALLDRGITVYTVSPVNFVDHAHVREHAEVLEQRGAHVRFADDLPHRLVVVDRRVAFLPVDVNRPAAGAIVVTELPVVASLHRLAASIIRRSRSLTQALASSVARPSELERQVLMLMSAGLTDAASAKHLHVTERQYRRYVARVMDRLDATSRFQAGVRAVERGWL